MIFDPRPIPSCARRVRVALRLRSALLLLALSLLPFPAQSATPPAHPVDPNAKQAADVPAGPATISGRVVDENDPEMGIAGVQVALYALSASGGAGLRRATSERDGSFRFEGISNAPETTYLTGARHMDIPFPGRRIVFAKGELEQTVIIPVSVPTLNGRQVEAPELELRAELLGGRLQFVEIHSVVNGTNRAVNVPRELREGAHVPFLTALPEGATDFNMPFDVIPDGIEREGDTLRFWGPLFTGPQDLSFSYHLPISPGQDDSESEVRLRKTFPRGLAELTVLVPENGPELSETGRLVAGEIVERGHDRYRSFTASSLAAGEQIDLRFALPAATRDPAALKLGEVTFFLEHDEARLDVTEQYEIVVKGDRFVLGDESAPVLKIPLPADAMNFQVSENAMQLGLTTLDEENALVLLGPIPPGESSISVGYLIPASTRRTVFERGFEIPVDLLTVLIADTQISADSDRLHARRAVRLNDGRIHLYLEGYQIQPGEIIDVALETLPARKELSRPMLAGTLVLMGLAPAFFLTTPLRRKRRANVETEAELPEAERERAQVIAAIHDLDDDLDSGILSQDDYERFRKELRSKAIHLLQQEKAGSTEADATPPAATVGTAARAAASCSQCGNELQGGDRFCSQCGDPVRGATTNEETPA